MASIFKVNKLILRLASSGALAFLFALFGHAGVAAAATCDPSASVHITGVVKTQNGTNVPSVSVTADAPGTTTVEFGPCLSLSDGTYEIDVNPGTYDLHFVPPAGSGLTPFVYTNFTVMTDQVLNVTTTPITYSMSGHIYDVNGTPVSNTAVTLYAGSTAVQAYADSAGFYKATIVPGLYTVEVDGTNTANYTEALVPTGWFSLTGPNQVDLRAGNLTQDFKFSTAKITVTILDAAGHPVVGQKLNGNPAARGSGQTSVQVNADSVSFTGAGGFPANGPDGGNPATDGQGQMVLSGLMGFTYENLCTVLGGQSICSQPFTLNGDTSITLAAPSAYALSGHIYDVNGTPVSNTTVTLYAGSTVVQANADSTGFYKIAIAPGRYTVEIDGTNTTNYTGALVPTGWFSLIGPNQVDLTSGNVTQDFKYTTAKITVTVLDATGRPVVGQKLNGNPAARGSGQTPIKVSDSPVSFTGAGGFPANGPDGGNPATNAQGQIFLTGLSGFTYENICSVFSGTSICAQPFTLAGDTSLTLAAPSSYTLSGHIYDANGNPVSNTAVTLYAGTTAVQATADSTGFYKVTITPGTYTLEIDGTNTSNTTGASVPTGWFSLTSPNQVNLTGGNVVEDFKFSTAKITVTILDADGHPVVGQKLNGNPAARGSGQTPIQINGNSVSFTGAGGFPANGPDGGNPATNAQGQMVINGLMGFAYNNLCTVLGGQSVCAQSFTLSGDTSFLFQQSPPVPATPTGLQAHPPVTNTAPVLSWATVTSATSYNIYRNGTLIGTTSQLSFTDNSLVSSGNLSGIYNYTVTALNTSGESQASVLPVTYDIDNPSISASAMNADGTPYTPGTWTSQNVTVQFTCSDALSGIATCPSPVTVSASGSTPVSRAAADKAGNTTSISVTINIDQVPSINALSSATLGEGDTFFQNGSFTDSDSTSWSATVDYGDGTGSQPLTLSGTSFVLSHAYKDQGSYTVTVDVTDNQGAMGTKTASVTTNNIAPLVGAISAVPPTPVQTGTTITASASFTDPGVLDTHTSLWTWGDGSSSTAGTMAESNGSGSVANQHTYSAAGVFEITLTVTDKDGASTVQKFDYLSVYSATSHGIFSAGSMFSSPAGAYSQDSNLTGRAQFGLSYKYQGALPSGNRAFTLDFNAANLHFNATTVSTLVIDANNVATLTGTGTLTGQSGTYSFTVVGSQGANTIRIQIKDSTGNVIYDTQPGATITASPTVAVTGRVVAHQ